MSIAGSCVSCHSSMLKGAQRSGAPEGYDFDLLEVVRDKADEMYAEVEDGAMPPTGALNATQVESIRIYLACGAQAQ